MNYRKKLKEKKRRMGKKRGKARKDQDHLNHHEHVHLLIHPWLAQELSSPFLEILSQTLTLDFSMHGWSMNIGNCSIISRVSSRSSLAQSSHESPQFLSNAFLWIFTRILMNGQIPLFYLEAVKQDSISDIGGLEVTKSHR
jgi:hypothetical protein